MVIYFWDVRRLFRLIAEEQSIGCESRLRRNSMSNTSFAGSAGWHPIPHLPQGAEVDRLEPEAATGRRGGNAAKIPNRAIWSAIARRGYRPALTSTNIDQVVGPIASVTGEGATTRTAPIAPSSTAIPGPRSSCRHAPLRCRASRRRPSPHSTTGRWGWGCCHRLSIHATTPPHAVQGQSYGSPCHAAAPQPFRRRSTGRSPRV
jgi:hypothetical protein